MSEAETEAVKAYRRAAIGLLIAAAVWSVAYFVARDRGWGEESILIPIAAAALAALCYARYRKLKAGN
jgi:hypothetical protein